MIHILAVLKFYARFCYLLIIRTSEEAAAASTAIRSRLSVYWFLRGVDGGGGGGGRGTRLRSTDLLSVAPVAEDQSC